ncbi:MULTISPECIES: hypothetical protein [unclassified Streptomyces]|nr:MULTISPECIES: hypothetical protein [unclassified Streptomyces]
MDLRPIPSHRAAFSAGGCTSTAAAADVATSPPSGASITHDPIES